MQDNLNTIPQIFGNICWDKDSGKYYLDNDRPAFKHFIINYMNTGQNRCHSISFHLLSAILCDFANNLTRSAFQSAISHMQHTFGDGIKGYYSGERIPEETQESYMKLLINYTEKLERQIGRAQSKAQWEKGLSQFLSHLNSCPFNLRYPANPGINWNQSVGEDFDPRMWCYVNEDGDVVSDDKSLNLIPTPFQTYCISRGKEGLPDFVDAGFYILDKGDGYLLTRMFQLAKQKFLSQQYLNHSQLGLSTSISADKVPYLPSSSNLYEIQPLNPFQANIYFLYIFWSRRWQQF